MMIRTDGRSAVWRFLQSEAAGGILLILSARHFVAATDCTQEAFIRKHFGANLKPASFGSGEQRQVL